MIPGEYNFSLYEGATFAETWTRAGITTATGYTAAVDIRVGADEAETRLLALTTGGGGLSLSSDGTDLSMSITITAAQAATVQQGAQTAGTNKVYYDWKLVGPSSTEYPLAGYITVRRRITT